MSGASRPSGRSTTCARTALPSVSRSSTLATSSASGPKAKLRLSEVDRQDDADRDHLTGQIDTSSPLESVQNNAVFSVMVANVTAP